MFFLSIFLLKFLMTLARAICVCYGAARGHTTYGLEMRTWNNKGFSGSSTSGYSSSVTIVFYCHASVWQSLCHAYFVTCFGTSGFRCINVCKYTGAGSAEYWKRMLLKMLLNVERVRRSFCLGVLFLTGVLLQTLQFTGRIKSYQDFQSIYRQPRFSNIISVFYTPC